MTSGLPPYAAWRFTGGVDGFEVLYANPGRLRGYTSAVEDGQPYAVRYDIRIDERWRTRWARVTSDTLSGERSVELESDGQGHWTVDGTTARQLDGLMDVDLEASACTNTLPIHRAELPLGVVTELPAAYVQALTLTVRRLDQTYSRLDQHRFHYTAEGGFAAELRFDDAGLILDYPGIAVRFA